MRRVLIRAFVVIILAAAALEAGARLLITPGAVIPHPVVNHIWRPNGVMIHDEWQRYGIAPYEERYNSQSFIGTKEYSRSLPADTDRIIFIGDSFTQGTCPEEQSMPRQVQALLAPRRSGRNVEVINSGTPSYSPILYYLRSKHQLLGFDAGAVVISVDMTDVFDDFLYKQALKYGADGDAVACPPRSEFSRKYARTQRGVRRRLPGELILSDLGSYSKFIGYTADLTALLLHRRVPLVPGMPQVFDWCMQQRTPETTALVAESMRYLEKSVALFRKKGTAVLVTGVPHLEHFTGEFSEQPLHDIREAAERSDAIYVDSFGGLRERLGGRDPREFYIPNDMHLNARGYAAWGEVIADAILRLEVFRNEASAN